MSLKILQLGEDLWVNELRQALGEQGAEVGLVALTDQKGQKKNLTDLLREIDAFKPDYTLGRNYYVFTSPSYCLSLEQGLELGAHLASRGITHLAWQLDAPLASGSTDLLNLWNSGFKPDKTVFFVTDKTHTAFYADRGIPCHHLPMAAPMHYLKASFTKKTEIPLSFAGTAPPFPEFKRPPATGEEAASFYAVRETLDFARSMEAFKKAFPEEDQKRLYGDFNAFFSGWPGNSGHYNQMVQDLLTGIHNVTGVKGSHSGFLDLRFSFCQLVRSLLELKSESLRVFGGEGWRQWLGDYQTDYKRLDFATEIPQVFHDSTITFCLTKWQYRTAVHDRPLSVLACGGFPLTDYREDLDTSFEPGEIISYQSLDQAKDLIHYYSAHESERLAVIQKGRERVRKDHTYANRAKEMLQVLGH